MSGIDTRVIRMPRRRRRSPSYQVPGPGSRVPFPRQSGVTLIELVVSIVIIGIALAGVLLVLNRTIATSGDPMIQQQAVAIGEAYIEEIIGKAYDDPDGSGTEASRDLYDDILDYNGLFDAGAHDQTGTAIAGLGSYDVGVSVVAASLNGSPARLITVTVSHSGIADIVLATYRLDY
ncbi:MAG TPA: prepilin-type N-terminal cleavage/methylation domain-containing protein [Gammaproteobacteria bacterium]|nr:prepilin-type N-terminal cleavage/methylation domain-containing protein [Gammaproteobacteria bacterium]